MGVLSSVFSLAFPEKARKKLTSESAAGSNGKLMERYDSRHEHARANERHRPDERRRGLSGHQLQRLDRRATGSNRSEGRRRNEDVDQRDVGVNQGSASGRSETRIRLTSLQISGSESVARASDLLL
jgi:hypothetical protein